MCQMHTNSDFQLWNWFLTIDSDSTHQKWMKFAFIVTCSIFFQSYWVSDIVARNLSSVREDFMTLIIHCKVGQVSFFVINIFLARLFWSTEGTLIYNKWQVKECHFV